MFKHPLTFAALAVNTLHHLFRKDKIREMTTVVILRAGHDPAVLKLQQYISFIEVIYDPSTFIYFYFCMHAGIIKTSAGFTESDGTFV